MRRGDLQIGETVPGQGTLSVDEPVDTRLLLHPGHQLPDSLMEGHRGSEAERIMNAGDVAEAMADVALAKDVLHLGVEGAPEMACQEFTQDEEVGRGPGADVEGLVVGSGALHGQQVGADDVPHVGEVAALPAVLVEHGGLTVEEPAGEDGGHSRVGVREGLPRAIGVEVAQGDRGKAVGAADGETELLLVALGHGVDRGGREPLRFRGRQGLHGRSALRAEQLPQALPQLVLSAERGINGTAVGAAVGALPVDGHRRGDQQLLDPMVALGEQLQQGGGAQRVGCCVGGDLVHALTDAHARGLVEDDLHALQGSSEGGAVLDVADLQLDRAIERLRKAPFRAVHLGFKGVVDPDGVAGLQQGLDKMPADEPGATSDQDLLHDDLLGRVRKGTLQTTDNRCTKRPQAGRRSNRPLSS